MTDKALQGYGVPQPNHWAADWLKRRGDAFDRFVDVIEQTLDRDAAEAVASLYVKERIARYNGLDYRVTHGRFLDAAVLRRAARMAAGERVS